ncbi:MbtH family NRPS accessory protein [Streptomyces sp. NPDC096323]|uniref:MbtH family protein n=1 Tax=Streptomyces sp. NPDC096323 TaxID=3155822 RepID=UPI0033173CC9
MPEDNTLAWKVLINDEEQYALFPEPLSTPGGWREAGFTGSEEACAEYVDTHWTDMRPRSLREAMDGAESAA